MYAALKDDVRYGACHNLLNNPVGPLYLSPQILAEFYSVITNPKRVTAPFTGAEAIEFIGILLGYPHTVLPAITADVPPFGLLS